MKRALEKVETGGCYPAVSEKNTWDFSKEIAEGKEDQRLRKKGFKKDNRKLPQKDRILNGRSNVIQAQSVGEGGSRKAGNKKQQEGAGIF